MAYEKQNFIPGQKLKASELNHMEDGIANAVSVTDQTLSEEQKAQARANIGAAAEGEGADGYTPVKGTDYFTPEDIAAIVEEVVDYVRVEYPYVDLTEETWTFELEDGTSVSKQVMVV